MTAFDSASRHKLSFLFVFSLEHAEQRSGEFTIAAGVSVR